MLAERKYYAYDYDMDSTVRKKQYEYHEVNKQNKKRTNVNKKNNISVKTKVSTVLGVLAFFSLFMVIVYRYNVINEKNVKVQDLKDKLSSVQTIETSAQMAVEQSTDLNSIEAYAKQKLGMQKPGKNQVIYIDNSVSASVQSSSNTTIIDKVVNKVKEVINKIF